MRYLLIWFALLCVSAGPALAQLVPDPARAPRIAAAKRAIGDYTKAQGYWTEPIDWSQTEFEWVDLDGDRVEEAIVTPTASGYCGHVLCPNFIVKWTNGRAKVVDVVRDRILDYLSVKRKGWRDLRGYYFDYHWNGKAYEEFCRPGGRCNNG